MKALIFDLDGVIVLPTGFIIWHGKKWQTAWEFILMKTLTTVCAA